MGRVKLSDGVYKIEGTGGDNTKILAALGSINQKLDALESRMIKQEQKINEKLDFMLSEILDIAQGKKPITVNINCDPALSQSITTTVDSEDEYPRQAEEVIEEEDFEDEVEATEVSVADSKYKYQPSKKKKPITYRLSREVQTVPELWKEWHLGINGGPAVMELNSKDKYWYMDDKVFYHRRLRIIQAIKTYAAERGIPERVAMRMAEDIRLRERKDIYDFGHHRRQIFQ